MAMISTLVWSGRRTGATITGCTHDRAKRQVMDRIVETGGRCCLVADSRIGCSRQEATPTGMPFEDRWAAVRYAPVLDFRIDRLSSGRHFAADDPAGLPASELEPSPDGAAARAMRRETGNSGTKVVGIKRQLTYAGSYVFTGKKGDAGYLGSYLVLDLDFSMLPRDPGVDRDGNRGDPDSPEEPELSCFAE